MTEFEYIKAMDEDAFVNFMQQTSLDQCWCPATNICHEYNTCSDAFKAWLKSEHIKDQF